MRYFSILQHFLGVKQVPCGCGIQSSCCLLTISLDAYHDSYMVSRHVGIPDLCLIVVLLCINSMKPLILILLAINVNIKSHLIKIFKRKKIFLLGTVSHHLASFSNYNCFDSWKISYYLCTFFLSYWFDLFYQRKRYSV